MGCCSKDLLCAGCCCQNCSLQFPPILGCNIEYKCCCLGLKCCLALGHAPKTCCCCGPTCLNCNALLCKTVGEICCFKVQGSCPCGDDTPCICTLLPFCTIYPRTTCCATTDSIRKKPKVAPAGGAPTSQEMER